MYLQIVYVNEGMANMSYESEERTSAWQRSRHYTAQRIQVFLIIFKLDIINVCLL